MANIQIVGRERSGTVVDFFWVLHKIGIPLLSEIVAATVSTIIFKIFVQIAEDIKKPHFSVDIGVWTGYNAQCSTSENLCVIYCD